jgi:hypothetical protein
MKKSVVSRMSLRSDKDVETYLLKSRSDDNEKNELATNELAGIPLLSARKNRF